MFMFEFRDISWQVAGPHPEGHGGVRHNVFDGGFLPKEVLSLIVGALHIIYIEAIYEFFRERVAMVEEVMAYGLVQKERATSHAEKDDLEAV